MFGAYVIGDEILVGKRQDKHLPFLIEALARRGLRLSWALYLGDEPERITASLRRSFATDDVVFSFGGIGATPDDHTRQCAAAALDVGLRIHPEAEREIRGRFGAETTPQRLAMGEFPEGAEIIPNPVNRIPGFSLREHHFVPGFPQMAWPMIEWVLDTHYREAFGSAVTAERSLVVYETAESLLVPLMVDIEQRYPPVKAFSLPSVGDGADGRIRRRHIELGVKGPPELVAAAFGTLCNGVQALGAEFEQTA